MQWAPDPSRAHWTIAVNVSALQFAQPDFVQKLFATLDETGANASLLKLELTESMLAHDVDDIAQPWRPLQRQHQQRLQNRRQQNSKPEK
jgi:EAL domain-containing protein (putative c-di-GMP-specific phosphodiesterase class I)